MKIDSSSRIHPEAELGQDVEIGPFSIIGPNVKIGDGTIIGSHVVIESNTIIGSNNKIYHFTTIGTPAQDLKYKGEETWVRIGKNNTIREYVTIHRGTIQGKEETILGDGNFIMAYCHIAHDCKLGSGVIMANCATLGGHVEIGDKAVIGGLTAIHQFTRIGSYAFIGGKSAVTQDIPPYILAAGDRVRLYGINQKGLSRENFSKEIIDALKQAFRIVIRSGLPLKKALDKVKNEIPPYPEVDNFIQFIEHSKRGIPKK